MLEKLFGFAERYTEPKIAHWMLIAVQGLSKTLIPGLDREHAAALLKDRYTAAAERHIEGLLSSMPGTPARRQKIRALYELRDQRHREIDIRAEDYLSAYRDKFSLPDLNRLYSDFLQACFPETAAEMLPESSGIRREDLPILAMICRAVYGLKTKPMKHIVIDECQDFSPFMIELLKQANPAATFTLVGDLYQGIHSDEGIRSWNEWEGPVFRNQAKLTQLTVSYRNTVEIMNLASEVSGRRSMLCGGITQTITHDSP